MSFGILRIVKSRPEIKNRANAKYVNIDRKSRLDNLSKNRQIMQKRATLCHKYKKLCQDQKMLMHFCAVIAEKIWHGACIYYGCSFGFEIVSLI
jgi:hypothetical protein